MNPSEIRAWFEDLKRRVPVKPHTPYAVVQTWLVEAKSAVEAVFPPGHACRRDWERMETKTPINLRFPTELVAVFEAAYTLLTGGRLGSLIDAVRAETEDELLMQAEALVEANHLAAATVIAGGALETHLRHLVARYGLTISGSGSIGSYNTALAQARNNQTVTNVSASDTTQVTSWGQMRNDAAHTPGTFNRNREQIDLMIRGIREFIARTT